MVLYGRLSSIVRLNSESDIDEVTRLPVLVNNNIGESELKGKWWMRQSNRFNIRSIKQNRKSMVQNFHFTNNFHLYKVCVVIECLLLYKCCIRERYSLKHWPWYTCGEHLFYQ